MYTGKIDLSWENVEGVLQISDFLCMADLKEHCAKVLKANLTLERCLHVQLLTERFDLASIRDSVTEFLCPRIEGLLRGDEVLEYGFEFARFLLSNPSFSYCRDDILVDFVIRWVKHDEESRLSRLDVLLEAIEITYISPRIIDERLGSLGSLLEAVSNETVLEFLSLTATRGVSQNELADEDVILCRSRAHKVGQAVRLYAYYPADDSWMSLRSEPEPGCWDGIESMVTYYGRVYMLTSRTEDIRGPLHPAQQSKRLFKLEVSIGREEWSEVPAPEHVTGQTRLVSHSQCLLAIDLSGLIQKLDSASDQWLWCQGPRFTERPMATKYLLPMPFDTHLFVLRAYSSGNSWEFAQTVFSLHKFDLIRNTWVVISEVDSGDLDIGDNERFHGYTMTPFTLVLKNEIGLRRAEYDFRTGEWSPLGSPAVYPGFVDDVWGSVALLHQVYFTGHIAHGDPMLMRYDQSRRKFKNMAPPPECLSGLLCHVMAPKSLRNALASDAAGTDR